MPPFVSYMAARGWEPARPLILLNRDACPPDTALSTVPPAAILLLPAIRRIRQFDEPAPVAAVSGAEGIA